MKVLLSKNRVLSQTYEEFERCTQDQKVHELAYARECFQFDQRSSLKLARQDGFEEGLEEGKKEGKMDSLRELAQRMQAKGLAPELIQSSPRFHPKSFEQMTIGYPKSFDYWRSAGTFLWSESNYRCQPAGSPCC